VGEPIPPHEEVHYRRECVQRNESGYGSNKDNLDAKPANESTEHDNLKNAVYDTIRAQDVSDIARCKAKTTDIYRHGKEKWLDGV
jgi:hypothetical protein